MNAAFIPIMIMAILAIAFVTWGFIFTKITGKPFIVYNPGSPNGTGRNAMSDPVPTEWQEDLLRYVETPNRESYLALRAKIVSWSEFAPYSDELERAVEFCELKRLNEAIDTIKGAMGNLMLSPRAHQLLGFLYHRLGDEQAASIEMMMGQSCIEGLVSTGEGTEQNPYVVLRTSDEYDLIEHFDKEVKSQALKDANGKHLDEVECIDGSKYWFDITDAYKSLSSSLN